MFESLERAPEVNIDKLRYIGAFDSSYSGGKQYAVVVIYDLYNKVVVERKHAVVEVKAPYIPGYLAFREMPGYMRAYSKLSITPELVIVDGHGLAHPRGLGIASHLGLVIDKPSIGVAKHRLYGDVVELDGFRYVRAHNRLVGYVIEHAGQELYISIGYKIKLEDVIKIMTRILEKDKRLPSPLYFADEYSKTIKYKYTNRNIGPVA